MEKIINLLTLSQSFSSREKYLIYKIVKNNPEKQEKIIFILEKEQKKIEKIKKDFLSKISNFNLENLEKNNFLEEKQKFLAEIKKLEEEEKLKENLEIENLLI